LGNTYVDVQDDLAKSLWSEMMREVLVHVNSSPCTYLSGLQLLSELLPLPLPLPASRSLSHQVIHSFENAGIFFSICC
jgi:hypothetical protein